MGSTTMCSETCHSEPRDDDEDGTLRHDCPWKQRVELRENDFSQGLRHALSLATKIMEIDVQLSDQKVLAHSFVGSMRSN